MAFKIGRLPARASSAGNPITFTQDVLPGEVIFVLMLKVNGGTNRAGGAPTWGSRTFTDSGQGVQKAATSPEASTELWYLLNPPPVSATVTIPNTGALTVFRQIAFARGGGAIADGNNGSNGTSTNPTPGAVTPTEDGAIFFATVASGATTWAPTAQAGTIIQNTDDGAHGGGTQYFIQGARASFTLDWTFGTSDDWGAIVAVFKEIPANIMNNYNGPSPDHRLRGSR